ncbi:hypothetical protein LXL04_024971 [Taraxacum kok-saghyz]
MPRQRAVQMRTIIGGGNGGTNLGHLFQFAADQFSDAGALLSAQHIIEVRLTFKAKTSAVCGPHLQASAAEKVDQTSAVCKKKTEQVVGKLDQEKAHYYDGKCHHHHLRHEKRCPPKTEENKALLWVRKEEIEENQARQLRLLATAVASDGEDQAPARTGEHRTNMMQSFDRDAEREKGFDRWRKRERSSAFFFPNPESDKKKC